MVSKLLNFPQSNHWTTSHLTNPAHSFPRTCRCRGLALRTPCLDGPWEHRPLCRCSRPPSVCSCRSPQWCRKSCTSRSMTYRCSVCLCGVHTCHLPVNKQHWLTHNQATYFYNLEPAGGGEVADTPLVIWFLPAYFAQILTIGRRENSRS